MFYRLFGLFIFLASMQLNSSIAMTDEAVKIDPDLYASLFQPLGEPKAIAKLESGGQLYISKVLVGKKQKRHKLVAQFTDQFGKESEVDVLWLQPSLVYFMKNDTVLLKWHGGELFAFGLSDVITKKEL